MIHEITLEECPQVLRDRVNKIREHLLIEIISVQRIEITPYEDESNKITKHKVFTRRGMEFGIYSTRETTGGNFLDGEVSFNSINLSELETIVTKVGWVKSILRDKLN